MAHDKTGPVIQTPVRPTGRPEAGPVSFEIFVSSGFSVLEASAAIQTLLFANEILNETLFSWRFVSNKPGLVTGAGGMIVRAAPAISDHGLSDFMLVLGGRKVDLDGWLVRARQMKRKGLVVALLSEAATSYIRETKASSGPVTTHWYDAALLRETGYYPELSDRLSEKSEGIITSAGGGATAELTIGLIARYLKAPQLAELGNRLLLPAIRKSDASQPQGVSGNPNLFDCQISRVVTLMEETLDEPLSMPSLAREVGLSTRQVERMFRSVFEQSPARFYKHLRTKRAWTIIEETTIPLADVAAATGFRTQGVMAKAVQDAYGETPTKLRSRKKTTLLKFG